jgi:hypothetical protein
MGQALKAERRCSQDDRKERIEEDEIRIFKS